MANGLGLGGAAVGDMGTALAELEFRFMMLVLVMALPAGTVPMGAMTGTGAWATGPAPNASSRRLTGADAGTTALGKAV